MTLSYYFFYIFRSYGRNQNVQVDNIHGNFNFSGPCVSFPVKGSQPTLIGIILVGFWGTIIWVVFLLPK